MEQEKKSNNRIAIILFIGCATIGAAIGMLYDKLETGGAFGAGIGFFAVAAIWIFYRRD